MTLDYRYPTPLPSTKGWGPGYPDCQREAIVPVAPFVGGVHKNLAELVGLLVPEMKKRGLTFMVPGCWGFGCRGTKASAGSLTATPSFHSWGLALDINAPENVFGSPEATSKIATRDRWVVPFLTSYGFYWLGPPIKDWMHFSFVGSPADARDLTAKARRELGDDMDERLDQLQAGTDAFWAAFKAKGGDPGAPPATLKQWEKNGWANARRGSRFPEPGTPGKHEHVVTGKAE